MALFIEKGGFRRRLCCCWETPIMSNREENTGKRRGGGGLILVLLRKKSDHFDPPPVLHKKKKGFARFPTSTFLLFPFFSRYIFFRPAFFFPRSSGERGKGRSLAQQLRKRSGKNWFRDGGRGEKGEGKDGFLKKKSCLFFCTLAYAEFFFACELNARVYSRRVCLQCGRTYPWQLGTNLGQGKRPFSSFMITASSLRDPPPSLSLSQTDSS